MVQNESKNTYLYTYSIALKFRLQLEPVFFTLLAKFRGHSRAKPFSSLRVFQPFFSLF